MASIKQDVRQGPNTPTARRTATAAPEKPSLDTSSGVECKLDAKPSEEKIPCHFLRVGHNGTNPMAIVRLGVGADGEERSIGITDLSAHSAKVSLGGEPFVTYTFEDLKDLRSQLQISIDKKWGTITQGRPFVRDDLREALHKLRAETPPSTPEPRSTATPATETPPSSELMRLGGKAVERIGDLVTRGLTWLRSGSHEPEPSIPPPTATAEPLGTLIERNTRKARPTDPLPPLKPEEKIRTDFWTEIFTKYNSDTIVCYDQSDPKKVLLALNRNFGVDAEGNPRQVTFDDTVSALRKMSQGQKPSTDAERYVSKAFGRLDGATRAELVRVTQDRKLWVDRGQSDFMKAAYERSGLYLAPIQQEMDSLGLPREFAQLPIIESKYQPLVASDKGAVGAFQLTRGAASDRKLRMDDLIDERRDPIRSANAAARHLRVAHWDSNEALGRWPLSVTAYNAGLRTINKEVVATKTLDLETLLQTSKNKEIGPDAENYYARFRAAEQIAENVQGYYPGIKIKQPIPFAEIKLDKPTDYRTVMARSGYSAADFEAMNLSFLDPITTGKEPIPAGYPVRVHPDKATVLARDASTQGERLVQR